MPTLDELLKKHGVKTMENPTSGPRAKLMYQADKMITEIAEYENASEMNGENAKFW